VTIPSRTVHRVGSHALQSRSHTLVPAKTRNAFVRIRTYTPARAAVYIFLHHAPRPPTLIPTNVARARVLLSPFSTPYLTRARLTFFLLPQLNLLARPPCSVGCRAGSGARSPRGSNPHVFFSLCPCQSVRGSFGRAELSRAQPFWYDRPCSIAFGGGDFRFIASQLIKKCARRSLIATWAAHMCGLCTHVTLEGVSEEIRRRNNTDKRCDGASSTADHSSCPRRSL
jgi:hypothetical protein